MNKDEARQGRKAYGKPEVRRIELKPEESLAAGCKTATGASTGNTAPTPCAVSSCFDIGS